MPSIDKWNPYIMGKWSLQPFWLLQMFYILAMNNDHT